MNSGISILNQVAAGIGEFVGNLISGVGVGITDGLPAIGGNIKGFADSLSGVDPGAAEAASAIAGAVLALSAANVLDGLGNILQFIGGSSDANTFGQSLSALGEAMKSFCSSISGLSDDDVAKAELVANIMKPIVDIADAIPNTGGLLGDIVGNNDIDDFGERMQKLGSGISDFCSSISDLSDDDVAKAELVANIMKPIVDIADAIPNTGGLLGNLVGDNDIDDFGNRMEKMGVGISKFADSIIGLSDSDIERSNIVASIMESVVSIADDIPNTGGLLGDIVGNNDIDDFGNRMEKLGASISAFCDSVRNVSPSDVSISAYVFTIMRNIINAGDLASELDWEFYTIDWDAFTVGAQNMASGLLAFTNAFSDITTDTITATKYTIQSFKEVFDLASSFSSEGSSINSSLITNFKSFCDTLASAGPSIKKFVQGITGITTGQVSNAVSIVQQLGEMSSNLGSYDFTKLNAMADGLSKLSSISLDGFGAGIQNGGKEIGSAVSSMMSSMTGSIAASSGDVSSAVGKVISRSIQTAQAMSPKFHSLGTLFIQKLSEGITANAPVASASTLKLILRVLSVGDSQITKFYALGQSFIESLASGISSQQSLVIAAVQNICSGGVSGARSYYDSYYYAGENMVQGFANGIRNGTYLAVSASTDMAKKSLQAAKKILNEHSPSKEMYKIGAYASEGFANGITSYGNKVYTVSEKVANNALEAMSTAVTTINQALLNDMDTTPTIRPVVDLGGVKSGIGSIRSIFDNSNLTSYANVKSASRLMNAGSYKYGDGDIVKAVNDLKAAVLDAAGNTYQINGITYDDGSSIGDAVKTLVNAARIERRI